MTDRELLTLAAQAAGRLLPHGNPALTRPNEELRYDGKDYWFWPAGDSWNPLTDDGDALRLAVKLGLRVCIDSRSRFTWVKGIEGSTAHGNDATAATRRSIVRAAAEIGKVMQ